MTPILPLLLLASHSCPTPDEPDHVEGWEPEQT
jgi:hypothetical protein